MEYRTFLCCLGYMTITEDDGYIVGIRLSPTDSSSANNVSSPLLLETEWQLCEYLGGCRRSFEFPVRLTGTPFQVAVWEALRTIPYGQTCTYGEVATLIGRPGAARAVGSACHRNPLLIVVPCHRVVGSGGALTGFACGLESKRLLLKIEQK